MRVQGTSDGKQLLSALSELSSKLPGAVIGSAPASAGSEAAESFESYFSTMLVRELRKAMPEGFFSGSGSDVYGAWFDETIGKTLSERNALGFAGMIKADLARGASSEESSVGEGSR